MQEKYVLSFLQPQFPKLADIAYSIEKCVYNDPHGAIVKACLFGEAVAKEIWDKENLESVYEVEHVERIYKLFREGIIDEQFRDYFSFIHKISNKITHNVYYGSIVESMQIFRVVFKIAVWFMELYGDISFQAPGYCNPEMPQKTSEINNDELTELVSKTVEETIGKSIQTTIQEVFAQMMQQQEIINVAVKKQEETLIAICNEEKIEETLIAICNEEKIEETPTVISNEEKIEETPIVISNEEKIEETPIVISNEEKIEQVPDTTFDLVAYLQKYNVDVIDRREFGSTLWALGDWELNEILFPLKEKNIFFRFVARGNRMTKNKPAWFLFGSHLTNGISKTTTNKTIEATSKQDAQQEQEKTAQFDLLTYLKSQNVKMIDKRNRGGTLWVIGGLELSKILFPLQEHKVYFRYMAKGNRTTKNKPAWFLMRKNGEKRTSTIL
ncbi:hypothetical protein WAX78_02490 [Bacillus sp. FJAT-53711]|uniref:DUF4145 domain-containing protein n=1 Tax=Bacillus yunxiaonensis TaxID=3127665 RepID=A0ABU8FTK9_9BACI